MIEEVLYPAMEDFKLDIIIGKGPSARTLQLDLPKFTLISATTRPGLLSSPLRSRFGVTYRLDFYQPEDIEKIIHRSARILDIAAEQQAIKIIAKSARSTPRIANRLLKRVRDFAQVKGDGQITADLAAKALKMLEVDELGLEPADIRILKMIIEKYKKKSIYLWVFKNNPAVKLYEKLGFKVTGESKLVRNMNYIKMELGKSVEC